MCQLDNIMAKRDIIHKLAKRHKVKKVFVFGSCARKEETPTSDIDFLMEFEHNASFRDNIEFEDDLEKLFQCKVDVVSKRGLHPLIEDDVLREAIEV